MECNAGSLDFERRQSVAMECNAGALDFERRRSAAMERNAGSLDYEQSAVAEGAGLRLFNEGINKVKW